MLLRSLGLNSGHPKPEAEMRILHTQKNIIIIPINTAKEIQININTTSIIYEKYLKRKPNVTPMDFRKIEFNLNEVFPKSINNDSYKTVN